MTVADSGPGIPADAVDMVFEPFFRLARDEHSGIEGNGLGLAICRELVTQLHGEIALTSVVGQGTSVSVRFPIGSDSSLLPSRSVTTGSAAAKERTTAAGESEGHGRVSRRKSL